MPLIRPITWVDVWGLSHSLYARQNHLGKPHHGVRRLALLDDGKATSAMKGWRNAEIFLRRLRRLVADAMPQLEIARAELEMLDPGAGLPWTLGNDEAGEVHIGIVTNPAARIFAGIESWSVGWGEAVLSMPGAHTVRSAVNGGDAPRVHLILTLQKSPDQEAV